MLRLLLVLLVLANAAFYAWSQGWLSPWLPVLRADQREPERLQAQVKPELVVVMTPKAASAVMAAAVRDVEICLEAGPFTESAIAAAETAMTQNSVAEGSWTREVVTKGSQWAVYMGRFGDREVMKSKADELRRLNVAFEELSAPPLLAPGIKLSSHSDRAAAEGALEKLAQKGVRTARVVEMPSSAPAQTWLRIARADAEMQSRLKALPSGPLAGGFGPCANRGGQ